MNWDRIEGNWKQFTGKVKPVVNVLLGLVFGITVAGLNFALKLLAVAIDLGNVVVSELAPQPSVIRVELHSRAAHAALT